MRTLFSFLMLILTANILSAQTTISPVIAEGSGSKGKADIQIQNGGIKPIIILLEVSGFELDKSGAPHATVLPSTTKIDLSETSFIIGAKQQHSVSYTVMCPSGPCWGWVQVTTIFGKTTTGIAIRMILPQTFYFCPKQTKGSCRKYIRKQIFGLID